ncbi:hypothetical protein GEV33_015542 [Tenebrio molitor]|uniref:Uncharacterized protein n=1 Tax=Tenebrio molitor TaxID=7067 RepID=A0A8J6L0F9_TENMO|nr:hypothetical protein GEV33_015542 [Tenebrio molitor]
MFRCGVVKFVIKLTFSLYSFLLLAQTYFFVLAQDADQLIQYGPLFFQMCYATLGMFVVLLGNRMIEDVMEVIDLWDVKSAGEEAESTIKRESRAINIFVKFQMYMFNKYVEDLTKGFTTCECKFLFDEVNFRLKFLIKRHCDFLL